MPGDIHDQTVVLPRIQLMASWPRAFRRAYTLRPAHIQTVLTAVGLVSFISTLDSTCVATAQPAIAAALDAGSSVTWVGTSYNIASTVPQLLAGRLSDIFGRKPCLQVALAVFALGNLLCGFAQTAPWLYACRALAGLGGGALNSLGIIVVADVVSLRERGKYIGLVGALATLGLGLGPAVGGALAQGASWRWCFWLTVPVSAACAGVIQRLVPLRPPPGGARAKLAMVDWAGCGLATAGAVLVLVPVSSAGTAFAWSSAASIALLAVGAALALAFVAVEHRAPLPVLPLRLFRERTVALTLGTMLLVGLASIPERYVAPLYFQNVLAYSPVVSGALLLPLVMTQMVAMVAVGWLMRRFARTKLWIIIGYAVWTAGQAGQIVWPDSRNVGLVAGMLVLQGIGFGMTSQSSLVLAQACAAREDRAVVSSARAFFRQLGGSAGLAISTAVISAGFRSHLPADLPAAARAALLASGFTAALDVSPAELAGVRSAYHAGVRTAFIVFAPAVAACLLLVLAMKDANLDQPGPAAPRAAGDGESSGAAARDAARSSTPTTAPPAAEPEAIELAPVVGTATRSTLPAPSPSRRLLQRSSPVQRLEL